MASYQELRAPEGDDVTWTTPLYRAGELYTPTSARFLLKPTQASADTQATVIDCAVDAGHATWTVPGATNVLDGDMWFALKATDAEGEHTHAYGPYRVLDT